MACRWEKAILSAGWRPFRSASSGAIGLLLVSSGVLTQLHGIHGAAWAVLLTYACWLLAMAIVLNRLGETRIDFMASMPTLGKATY